MALPRIAINGFGRIGRTIMRIAKQRQPEVEHRYFVHAFLRLQGHAATIEDKTIARDV